MEPAAKKKARRKPASLLQMTMNELRRDGCRVGITERWLSFQGGTRKKFGKSPGVRQDLFGFIDAVVMEPGRPGLLAVNACARTDLDKHHDWIMGKATGDRKSRRSVSPEEIRQNAIDWLERHNRISLYGWERFRQRGKWSWARVVRPITLGDFGLGLGRTNYLAHIPGIGYLESYRRCIAESNVESWRVTMVLFPETCPTCLSPGIHRADCPRERLLGMRP